MKVSSDRQNKYSKSSVESESINDDLAKQCIKQRKLEKNTNYKYSGDY